MSGKWISLACGSVREPDLRAVLTDQEVDWATAAHVAATGSLARAVRGTGAVAVAIANLIDVIVWSGVEEDLRVDAGEFPPHSVLRSDGPDAYERALGLWRGELAGRRINMSMNADLRLRRFLTTQASDRTAAVMLRRSQREFRKSVQTLIAADIRRTI
jgi:hypothetical protein